MPEQKPRFARGIAKFEFVADESTMSGARRRRRALGPSLGPIAAIIGSTLAV